MSMNIFEPITARPSLYDSFWPRRPELNSMFLRIGRSGHRVRPRQDPGTGGAQRHGAVPVWRASLLALRDGVRALPAQPAAAGTTGLASAPIPACPSLATWYREINGKMNEQGGQRQLVARPRYEELADTLNAAFKQLDKSFLYE